MNSPSEKPVAVKPADWTFVDRTLSTGAPRTPSTDTASQPRP